MQELEVQFRKTLTLDNFVTATPTIVLKTPISTPGIEYNAHLQIHKYSD